MKHFTAFALLMITLTLYAPKIPAQVVYGTVRGICKEANGRPIEGVVVWTKQDGQKYALRTNQKGQYFSLGIAPGIYNVTLFNAAANKEISHVNGFVVLVEENTLDFDLALNRQKPMDQQQTLEKQTQEVVPAPPVQGTNLKNDNEKIRYLNSQLFLAQQARTNGNFDQSASILSSALTTDPTQDLLWFWLGESYRFSGDYAKAIHAYEKAIEIKPAFGPYHNNLGEAYGKSKRTDDALSEYAIAAQVDNSGAAAYIFNMGAVLTNNGRSEEAISAFTLTNKLDPTKADAYYWKGINLLGLSKIQGNGSPPMLFSPGGTKRAFEKYLELSPAGQYSKQADQSLRSIASESVASVPYEQFLTQAFEAAQPYNSREEYKIAMDTEIAELRRHNSVPVWSQKVSDFWSDPTIASALQHQLFAEVQAEAQARTNARAQANAQAQANEQANALLNDAQNRDAQTDESQPEDDARSHSKVASFLSVVGLVLNTTNAGLQQAAANKVAQQQERLAAQQAAQQQAQLAAQQAAQQSQRLNPAPATQAPTTRQQPSSSGTSNTPSGSSSSGSAGSTKPRAQASDLGITQNFVDPACNGGATNAHYEITNNSYYNANLTVQLTYQVGGVQSTWNPTQNVGPRSSNDYVQQIPCSDQVTLSDFGNSAIVQWRFF